MSTAASDTAHLDFTDREHAIVVIGGHPPDRRVLGELPLTRDVICADSGLDHALRLGLVPTTVIGDMDSVDSVSLATARASGCTIIEHSTDKDATDTELALAHAVARGHRNVTLLWGGGDRIDHVLGVIAALAHPSLAHLDGLRVWLASDRMDIVHSGRALIIDHDPQTVLSLMPIGPRSAVVTTRGLQWELDRSPLCADSARGVSNVVVDSPCSIRSDDGVTAVITPGLLAIRNGRTSSMSSPGAQR